MTFKNWCKPKSLLLVMFGAFSVNATAQQLSTSITTDQLYCYYFNATHKNNFTGKERKIDLEKEVGMIESYIEETQLVKRYREEHPNLTIPKFAEFSGLDQFDRKRISDAAMEEIKTGMQNLDYEREFTTMKGVAMIGDYFFEKNLLQFYLPEKLNSGRLQNRFYLTFLNAIPATEFYFRLGPDDAEKLVKNLEGKKVENHLVYVIHFKVLPYCYLSQHIYPKSHLGAIMTKLEFFHRFYNESTDQWEIGDKIGEQSIDTKIFPNPEINTR